MLSFGPRSLVAPALALLAVVAQAQAPHVRRLDVAPDGSAGNGDAFGPRVTPDGSLVLYASRATNLVTPLAPGSTASNLFLVDVRTGATEQVNLGSVGQALDVWGLSESEVTYDLSADGRFVVFQAVTDDAALGDTNGLADIYLRDRVAGTTELLTAGADGTTGATSCLRPQLSEDGQRVLFLGNGKPLLPGGVPTGQFLLRLYLHDRTSATTSQLAPLHPGQTDLDNVLVHALSGDGSRAAFMFWVTSATQNVLRVQDLDTGVFTDHAVPFTGLSLDRTGGTLVGWTTAPLVAEDTDTFADVYRLDPATGAVTLVSPLPPGPWGDPPVGDPRLSPDGRYVCFSGKDFAGPVGVISLPHDGQVFVHDLETGLTTLGSINGQAVPGGAPSKGATAAKTWGPTAINGSLSERGELLVYTSNYHNLAKPDGIAHGLFAFDRRTAGPQLTVAGLAAGGTATLTVTEAAPGGAVLLGLSTGQGPIPSYWGPLHLSQPIHHVHVPTDAAGVASLSVPVAGSLVGTALHAQGLDILGYEPTTPWYGVVQ